MSRNKRHTRCWGIATTEFALVLPFLFFLVMGLVEAGYMSYSWLAVQKAAQTGARFAATGQGDEEGTRMTEIVRLTEEWLAGLDKGGKEVTVSSWPSSTPVGDGIDNNAGGPCNMVEVAVVYEYHPFTPLVGALLPNVVEIYGRDRKLNEPWKPCDG